MLARFVLKHVFRILEGYVIGETLQMSTLTITRMKIFYFTISEYFDLHQLILVPLLSNHLS